MFLRRAFTLVELLVVIAIIGLLVAILLPAIQASREAARKTQCKNNLRQIGTAFLSHESAHDFLPTSGWGYKWVGIADGGFGEDQPGGWAYNILPYLEENALHDAAMTTSEMEAMFNTFGGSDNVRSSIPAVSTALAVFHCPTKRLVTTYPLDPDPSKDRHRLANNAHDCSVANGCTVARGDYRVNSGSIGARDAPGPANQLLAKNFAWMLRHTQNGISYQRSDVRIGQITDGTSRTAMVGEKYLNPQFYENGKYTADDQCLFSGHDNDNNGYTATDSAVYRPQQDHPGVNQSFYFGSAHAVGLHMAYCDGSVHFVEYEIDDEVWRVLGGRNDETQ
jgi:prepilin-type N-terminal cleavage/methylation domain-containing protein